MRREVMKYSILNGKRILAVNNEHDVLEVLETGERTGRKWTPISGRSLRRKPPRPNCRKSAGGKIRGMVQRGGTSYID
jgi:hypothetical protein